MQKSTDVYLRAKNILADSGINEAAFEAGLIFTHIVGKSRFETDYVTEGQYEKIIELCSKRIERYPLQYILGYWPFLEADFKVGQGVLIPRQESEEVCLEAIDIMQSLNGKGVVYDLCSGSGIFAISIQKRFPEAKITAVEKSPEAFAYLQENTALLLSENENKPRLIKADVFDYHNKIENNSADLIISNPPYVSSGEYEKLEPELFHEPKMALVPPNADDSLMFYSFIGEAYYSKLKNGAFLIFEIGSGQGKEVVEILNALSYKNVLVKRDMSGLDRVVIAVK